MKLASLESWLSLVGNVVLVMKPASLVNADSVVGMAGSVAGPQLVPSNFRYWPAAGEIQAQELVYVSFEEGNLVFEAEAVPEVNVTPNTGLLEAIVSGVFAPSEVPAGGI